MLAVWIMNMLNKKGLLNNSITKFMLFPPSLRSAAVTSCLPACVCTVRGFNCKPACDTYLCLYAYKHLISPLSSPFIKLPQKVCVMPVMEGFCHFSEIVHSSQKLS